jgi:O-antigen/teichoic acid export membrane protein
MILARLLAPEAFGAVAIITVVVSFVELFTDAGFQKYLIQHDFKIEDDLNNNFNVAFISNFFLSILFCSLIIVFRDWIAKSLGNDELGMAIAVSCISIPISALSSIQTALFRRDFDFKTLFVVRIVNLVATLLITIPLAIIYRSYWAIIFGVLASKLINAVYLSLKSNWKPSLYYNLKILYQMLSFTSWSILESVFIWMSGYIGIIIVGMRLEAFYLGLYQTSITLVGQILTIGVSAITPVLFSTLSRLRDDENEFKRMFLFFQGIVAVLIIPFGFILFSYQKFVTLFFLGNQWVEAGGFVGLLGLTTCFVVIYSHLNSEVFRAKGKPRLSILVQLIFVLFFIPSMIMSVEYDFEVLYVTHSLLQLLMIFVSSALMYYYYRISLFDMFRSTLNKVIVGLSMFIISLFLKQVSLSFYWQLFSIVVCFVFYFGLLYSIKREREFLINLKAVFLK